MKYFFNNFYLFLSLNPFTIGFGIYFEFQIL
jgi:hypothetical protein